MPQEHDIFKHNFVLLVVFFPSSYYFRVYLSNDKIEEDYIWMQGQ